MKNRIAVITGTRAEYGLLLPVIEGLQNSGNFDLQLIVTGMHLSNIFGLTYQEIENDGFSIDGKVDMLGESDSPVDIADSVGKGILLFAKEFNRLRPDLVVVLGDRYEIFAAATAATVMGLPIAHIHGGESTEGLIDEALRHSITKMSHLHFVSLEKYRRRIIQLGEDPTRVFLVGSLGVENIERIDLIEKSELEKELNIRFRTRNLLITFHPVTLESKQIRHQMLEVFAALEKLRDTTLVFTMSNSDSGGREIISLIEQFALNNSNVYAFTSLGQKRYFSLINVVDAVVGNSSSGLIEVPTFKKATINIGDRQKGRIRASSVIDCLPERSSILNAIQASYKTEFQKTLQNTINPYKIPGTSENIINTLRSYPLDSLLKKKFFDLEIL
jgi:GDP/UDP-N,N'-diacetylbacillosamine 2-epimerase (hydrolysing)